MWIRINKTIIQINVHTSLIAWNPVWGLQIYGFAEHTGEGASILIYGGEVQRGESEKYIEWGEDSAQWRAYQYLLDVLPEKTFRDDIPAIPEAVLRAWSLGRSRLYQHGIDVAALHEHETGLIVVIQIEDKVHLDNMSIEYAVLNPAKGGGPPESWGDVGIYFGDPMWCTILIADVKGS